MKLGKFFGYENFPNIGIEIQAFYYIGLCRFPIHNRQYFLFIQRFSGVSFSSISLSTTTLQFFLGRPLLLLLYGVNVKNCLGSLSLDILCTPLYHISCSVFMTSIIVCLVSFISRIIPLRLRSLLDKPAELLQKSISAASSIFSDH